MKHLCNKQLRYLIKFICPANVANVVLKKCLLVHLGVLNGIKYDKFYFKKESMAKFRLHIYLDNLNCSVCMYKCMHDCTAQLSIIMY